MARIERLFGAYDSELKGGEYTIPDGMDAEIKDGKIIVKERESEDEVIRKAILGLTYIDGIEPILTKCSITAQDIRAYLEKQKNRGPLTKEEEYILYRIIEFLEDETCPSEWISLLHDIYCLPYEKQKEQKEHLHCVIPVLSDGCIKKAIEIYPEECDCKVNDVVKAIIKKY